MRRATGSTALYDAFKMMRNKESLQKRSRLEIMEEWHEITEGKGDAGVHSFGSREQSYMRTACKCRTQFSYVIIWRKVTITIAAVLHTILYFACKTRSEERA